MLGISAEEEEPHQFYEQLQAEIILIVIGDWNVKVGENEEHQVVGKYGLGNRRKFEEI